MIWLLACAESTLNLPEIEAEGVALTGVQYVDQAVLSAGGVTEAGWWVESNLGWTVEVEDAWYVSYTTSLVACEDVVSQFSPWQLLGIGTAWAGHSGDTDPSATLAPYLVDLMDLQPQASSTVLFPATRYCRLHHATGPAPVETVGLDRATDLYGLSLSLSGTATSAKGEEVQVEVRTSAVHGLLTDLEIEASDGTFTTLTLERDLSFLFDDVDFSTDADPSWTILSNLIHHTTIRSTP